MNTTNSWICDCCGGTIERANDGWVEWLVRPSVNEIGRALRLVHHFPASPHHSANRCQYDEDAESARDGSIVNDLPLESFFGADGLMHLLSFIGTNELPTDEVLEMIKRLHIPGYEHARLHFDEAIAEQIIEPNGPEGYYTQAEIAAVLDFGRKNT